MACIFGMGGALHHPPLLFHALFGLGLGSCRAFLTIGEKHSTLPQRSCRRLNWINCATGKTPFCKSSPANFDMNASLKTLASEYDDRMRYVLGRAREQLGLSAVLIRPDRFIAWASDNDPDCSEVQKTAARWFVIQGGSEIGLNHRMCSTQQPCRVLVYGGYTHRKSIFCQSKQQCSWIAHQFDDRYSGLHPIATNRGRFIDSVTLSLCC